MTIHSVLIQKLLSTSANSRNRVVAHHFKVFTYGARNEVAIIDSDKTLICLRNACNFIGNLVRLKGRVLFVNTNYLHDEIIEQMTQRIGIKNDTTWRLSGFLTNRGSPRKFKSRKKKFNLCSIHPPDCVVLLDTERKSSVLYEADRLQIPVVGLVDSTMPWDMYKRITYPVPANDSVHFVYLFCNLITKTILLEQKRFAAAMGATAKEEEPPQIGEEVQDSAKYEISVLPYESLFPPTDAFLESILDKLAVLKFNRSLGEQMGFNGPISTIEACNGLTNLDLFVNQIESLNDKRGCDIPLILMNTIRTHDDTLKSETQSMTDGQAGEDEEYLSDDHEVFLSLKTSGVLDDLLSQGKEYILVVNSDNLAAVIDPQILNHLILNSIEYCMEVMPATLPNFQGSFLSSQEGKFQLSEIAHFPVNNVKFESMEKFKLIDTKNLWVNLKAIKRLLENNALKIENCTVLKAMNVDKGLLQETAASSTMRFFNRAIGINVPHSRFLSMSTTSDLLLAQSDLYTCAKGVLIRNRDRTSPANPFIELGPEFEKISDFHSRFKSIPSIIELDSLRVSGDVWFGAGVTLKGKVTIVAKPGIKLEIPDGVVLENKEISDPGDI
ncbi:UTP--glucose-1-phosphate uridylyltransferase-like isoform X2 [Cornus florida]|uniref:UTP--glucose-1-phosphate uridylyltransferase-like isoform X2 n=1 Tax=Cornus florida TaxID=4283 RepID=UPI00289E880C|nr:UTP--glucose-1-phosphate uridylyltransferase-like isoform X2 [Cornus florida]